MPALLLALVSILVWSTLAVLAWQVRHLPPLFSVGVALCLGGLAGLVRVRDWIVPVGILGLGVGGIFGYHALLFSAIHIAPPMEVNLLQYLWPLLIVVLAPVYLPRTPLKLHHVLGAVLGLAGAILVISGGRLELDATFLPGYLLALGAALTWASFSLLVKRVRPFPTGAVGGFCLVSGLLSLLCFWAGRPAPLHLVSADWLFLALLGVGPMGAAFYAWDAAMKRGDPRVIGALAYLTPLLSTLNLAWLGGRPLSGIVAAAMGLIVAGAVVGSMGLRGTRS